MNRITSLNNIFVLPYGNPWLAIFEGSTTWEVHQGECVNTVSLRLCLEYCQSCQFDQLVTLYLETNTFNLNIQVIFHHF